VSGYNYLFCTPFKTVSGTTVDKFILDNHIAITGDCLSHLGELSEPDEDMNKRVKQLFENALSLMGRLHEFMVKHRSNMRDLLEASILAERLAEWMHTYQSHRPDLKDEQVAIFEYFYKSGKNMLTKIEDNRSNGKRDPYVSSISTTDACMGQQSLLYAKESHCSQSIRGNDASHATNNKFALFSASSNIDYSNDIPNALKVSPYRKAKSIVQRQSISATRVVPSRRAFQILYSPALSNTEMLIFAIEHSLSSLCRDSDFFGVERFCGHIKKSLFFEFTPITSLKHDYFSGILRYTPPLKRDNEIYSTLIALRGMENSHIVQSAEEVHVILFTDSLDSNCIATETLFGALSDMFEGNPRIHVNLVHVGPQELMEPSLQILASHFPRCYVYNIGHNLPSLKNQCLKMIFSGRKPSSTIVSNTSTAATNTTPDKRSQSTTISPMQSSLAQSLVPSSNPTSVTQHTGTSMTSRYPKGHGRGKKILVFDTNILSNADCWSATNSAMKRGVFPTDNLHLGVSYSTLLEIDPIKVGSRNISRIARNFIKFFDGLHEHPIKCKFVRQEQRDELALYDDKINDEKIAHFCALLKEVDGYDEVQCVTRDVNMRNMLRTHGIVPKKDVPF